MIISNQKIKKAITTALADEDMLKIINSVTDESKSLRSIMTERNIAYTTAYRKTKWLLNQSLLVVDRFEIHQMAKNPAWCDPHFVQLVSSMNKTALFLWRRKKMLTF